MKRRLALLLIMLLMPISALANSWGLTGDLYSAVSGTNTWNAYHAMDQTGNVAAMKSRYHNALMLVMSPPGKLQVYTRALWQPDDNKGTARLAPYGNGFILSYGKSEQYCFALQNGVYLLEKAVIGDFTLALASPDGLYIGVQGSESARMYHHGGITLDVFSIRLLPRSVEEIRRCNHMAAALDSGSDNLGWYQDPMNPGKLYTACGTGSVPVWGAPCSNAWRGGKGKASVSLKGNVWVLREWVDDQGDVWLHIRYEVSQRTHRFGFIRADQLPGYTITGSDAYQRICVPVRTVSDPTIQTDDPLVSQFSQFDLPAGVELECLGMYNREYALVRWVNGTEAWFFIPLKDLEPVPGSLRTDVMAALDGCWYFWAGGNMSSDYLRLHADGTFSNPASPAVHGTWTVTDYDPAQGKYWNDPPYEITLMYSDGRVNVKGLSLTQEDTGDGVLRDGFSLTNWEGGGGYIRINEADVPLWDSEDGNG